MTLFQGKFRKNSLRRPKVDYSSSGYYFVTICTKGRNHYFGEIHEHKMILTKAGEIVWSCWHEIPIHFPNIKLGAFVVMPDHVHGIVIISQNPCRGPACRAPASAFISRVNTGQAYLTPTLGTVIGSFKSAVTRKIRENGNPAFGWLRRYHDHIIRDDVELRLIDRYIRDNPRRWRDLSR